MVAVYDPLERFNRSMYNFNTVFDCYVFLPVVSGYEYVTPDMVEAGVSNFFSNLSEIKYLVNNLLQGEFADSGITLGRFVINSTVGVLGVWDPSTKMGLFKRDEDFGQTLGKWGVGNGPYLVLPIFGPSSLRDAGGLAFDTAVKNEVDVFDLNDDANKDDIRIGLDLMRASFFGDVQPICICCGNISCSRPSIHFTINIKDVVPVFVQPIVDIL